jgi:hypothetical protein
MNLIMKYRIVAGFIIISFVFSERANCQPKTSGECLDIYNDCMRPKVLDRAKVSLEWIKQHIKDSDVQSILGASSEATENVNNKSKSVGSSMLWDFKAQNDSVIISPVGKETKKPIKYANWQKKCKEDFTNCLANFERSGGVK